MKPVTAATGTPVSLRVWRVNAGLSQEALAREAGVGVHTIMRIEQGGRRPHPATRKRIADALGVTVSDVAEFVADLPEPLEPWKD